MQVIKKNILAVICGTVALMSIVAIFWPISGKYQEITEQLDQSARIDQQLRSVASDGRSCKLPIVDPQKTTAPDLEGFPTDKVYKVGVEVVKKMQEQSAQLMARAIEDNRRDPVDPDALPTYRSGSARATFKDNYYNYLEALKKDGKDKKGRRIAEGLNSLPPPLPKDVSDEYARQWKEWEQKVPDKNGVRDPQMLQRVQEDFNRDVAPGLPATVAKATADACSMYLSTSGLYYHTGIPPQGSALPANLSDVWAAQIGLWIQSDICSAIAITNRNFSRPVQGRITVPNACVKRLVRTNINPAYVTANGIVQFAATGGMASPGLPMAVNPAVGMPPAVPAQATVVRSFQPTFTGRVSNDVYEVVHFSFTVDIEAANCRALLANLTNGRFITVLSTNVTALDRGACQAAGLIYGSEMVVQMTVNAEAVFFHDWTKKLMPEPVRQALEQALLAKNPGMR